MTKRQRKCFNHINQEKIIRVELYKCRNLSERHYDWIPELELLKSDRETLLNPVSWLTDSIIDAVQELLKDISPVPGLESVACGLTMSYAIQRGDFVEILNTGNDAG